ncbi:MULTISPECIES: Lrp/AsnC family transcriptional regulator [unclassified Sulfitobacter]|jgi:Lrp/AsnC family transcriptional regulator, leucine-responsive regulatory protein|uniref:Lrp/AsnC family transcriptional regulator n=1 Tax=unclassified Sulfitobacter TaxID=196795 RepID=UPI0007C2BCB3|nr:MULTISPECIES: Lrp/AsnC family transcriptional regulator [unclassified Sulfitobacter]KZY05512.1 AsnC family transcriptional regulator [Sulfitobacter sp. HI0023]KZY22543.1 AsnC family transcriptional regulator [Sulfitobacter sp. HI0040]KZZ70046.1 AsnC family transcriptional regulator [Sulfitobacter sp. HI0129]MAM24713.1 Lrp/AsnC family transcriptional regulator [Paracoccaceae bacterium]
MDDTDRKLLLLVQRDSRLPNAQLAEQLNISASACWRRVKALEEAGIITRYAAVVDPQALGLGFEAIVHVHLTRHDTEALDRFIAAVRQRDEVMDVYATTGQADYHLRVLCRDIDSYNAFLEQFLFMQPVVNSAQTNVILRRIKTNAPVRA